MRGGALRAVLSCGVLLALAGTAGCTAQARGATAATPAAPSAPGGGPALSEPFLAEGACSTRQGTVEEVACDSERAVARVTARHRTPAGSGPRCPARTDFVLHVTERTPAADEDGDGSVSPGYACMRKLRPPHPGDPGGGGGPRTITGDCLRSTGRGQVKETACEPVDGGVKPQFLVTRIVTDRSACPAGTVLHVMVGGNAPVGCARSLRQ
ncbi:hypothetical protein QNO07_22360 [Streptomyces sp. 549]|uniref:hypothetical protein n=1 Tax=Streptomyces sp. 549 TaxID=3049076 RepID=UPI0024C2D5F9|nr:hypothetical protein [Streptomyces sp. 549]MDK1476127.1 hypothetical protein [Streptomyces sp. 549]